MGGNPREHVKDKGFWDGGGASHGKNSEGAGRAGGFPGTRKPNRTGIRTDIEFPDVIPSEVEGPGGSGGK